MAQKSSLYEVSVTLLIGTVFGLISFVLVVSTAAMTTYNRPITKIIDSISVRPLPWIAFSSMFISEASHLAALLLSHYKTSATLQLVTAFGTVLIGTLTVIFSLIHDEKLNMVVILGIAITGFARFGCVLLSALFNEGEALPKSPECKQALPRPSKEELAPLLNYDEKDVQDI